MLGSPLHPRDQLFGENDTTSFHIFPNTEQETQQETQLYNYNFINLTPGWFSPGFTSLPSQPTQIAVLQDRCAGPQEGHFQRPRQLRDIRLWQRQQPGTVPRCPWRPMAGGSPAGKIAGGPGGWTFIIIDGIITITIHHSSPHADPSHRYMMIIDDIWI